MNPPLLQTYSTTRDGLGLPQIYKSIPFHPLRIIDFEYLPLFNSLFSYPKKSMDIKSREVFQMSYFKFILNAEASRLKRYEVNIISENLINFISFVTRIELKKDENGQYNIKVVKIDITENVYSLQLHINNVVFDETDFDNIREIIVNQNGMSVESIEDYNEDLERYLNHHNRFLENYDLNDQILFFASSLHKTVDEIKNCTIYQMKNQIGMLRDIQDYEMNVIALNLVNKEYKLPKVFEHITVSGRYDSILESVDDFKQSTNYKII